MNNQLKLGLTLFLLGLAGVLSMLTIGVPTDLLPPEVSTRFSPAILQLLLLINPTFMLLAFTFIGTILYEKVNLEVPTLSRWLYGRPSTITIQQQAIYGTAAGLGAGAIISVIAGIFNSSLPREFIELSEKIQPTPIARFLYGGITEEILMRFGFMTLAVWIVFKIRKNLDATTYWTGIAAAALLFAVGHLPIVFTLSGSPSAGLVLYILLGNSVAGLAFGWLYWKKGLEAAMIGHVFAHVAMLFAEKVFHLQ